MKYIDALAFLVVVDERRMNIRLKLARHYADIEIASLLESVFCYGKAMTRRCCRTTPWHLVQKWYQIVQEVVVVVVGGGGGGVCCDLNWTN